MKKYYSLKSYFWYLRQFRVRMVAVFVCFAISDAFLAVIPIFIGKLIGVLSVTPVDTTAVWTNVGILAACSTLHGIAWHSTEVLFMKFINPLTLRYETEMFRQVLAKPYPFLLVSLLAK